MKSNKIIKESQDRRNERVALAKCVSERVEKDGKTYKRHGKHKGQKGMED